MKILLDTNIILDAIASREPFQKEAQRIFILAAQERFEGFLTASSVTDIYYIARRYLTDQEAREALHRLFYIFTVIDVLGSDCEIALDVPLQDYEDAVISVCARKAGAEYIVTRDGDYLNAKSEPRTISPTDFLQMFDEGSEV